MPRQRRRYLGNPEFQHLRVDDDHDESGRALQSQEPCPQRHGTLPPEGGLSYQVEGEEPPPDRGGSDGRAGVITDVGSDDEHSPGGATTMLKTASRGRRTGDRSYEPNEPFLLLGGRQRSGGDGGGGAGSAPSSSRPTSSAAPPPRELRVRLTEKLSSRSHTVRRFVDFKICNTENNQQQFQVLKNEDGVHSLKNHDYLLRVRITMIARPDRDDPYVKDCIAEFKFRGRLYRYHEEKESFEELAVVSQCMAVCSMAECRKVPAISATLDRFSPP